MCGRPCSHHHRIKEFHRSELADVQISPDKLDARTLSIAWFHGSDTLGLTADVPSIPFTERKFRHAKIIIWVSKNINVNQSFSQIRFGIFVIVR